MKTAHANDVEVNPEYLPPAELWEMFEQLLPPAPARPKGGRPPVSDKVAFNAIYYVLRTGIQWKVLPRSLGAASTVHRRFQQWVRAGVFKNLWRWGLFNYDLIHGLDWEWQALDSAITKAPLGRENTGPNPADRAKHGTKRHLLAEGHAIPLAVVVTGAIRNDFKETRRVLEQIVVPRPKPTSRKKQHLCLDKGNDYPAVDELVAAFGYTAHISRRGEKPSTRQKIPGDRLRRLVVERTHSWMNRFRRILIRWEKRTDNYEASLHLACA